jgi:hypothetical protein
MGGIISGFLGGAGRGAAQAGQMLLADKLIKEREEANFLRDSQLRADLQASRQDFMSGLQTERIESDDARSAAAAKSDAETARLNREADAEQKRLDREHETAESKLERESEEWINKYKVDNDMEWIDVDGGNGLVIQARYVGNGKYEIPTADGVQSVTPSTDSVAAAAAEWAQYEKDNTNMIGLGGKSGAEAFTGMKKKDFLEKRAIEKELEKQAAAAGGGEPEIVSDQMSGGNATPTPETTPTPSTGSVSEDPDKWYKAIMGAGGEEKKAIETVQGIHPTWSPGTSIDLNPVSDAGASDMTGSPQPVPSATPGIVKNELPASIEKTHGEQMELYKTTGAAIQEIERQMKGMPYKDQAPLKKKLDQLTKMRDKAESYLKGQGLL